MTTPSFRRSISGVVTGVLPPTPTPGDNPFVLRQAAGWGIADHPLTQFGVYPFPVRERRCAVTPYTGFLPVTVTPGSGPVSFRQQAGWGYCGIGVGVTATSTAVVAFTPFVYRRRMQRMRARKRRFL